MTDMSFYKTKGLKEHSVVLLIMLMSREICPLADFFFSVETNKINKLSSFSWLNKLNKQTDNTVYTV